MYHISHVSNPKYFSLISFIGKSPVENFDITLFFFPRLCCPHLSAIYSVGRQCPPVNTCGGKLAIRSVLIIERFILRLCTKWMGNFILVQYL